MVKTIVITGASGYIGSEITKRYVSQGIKPHLVLRREAKNKRLLSILDSCFLHECDITDSKKTLEVFQKIKPQVVIHLASVGVYSYTDSSIENAEIMLHSNILGTLNLLYAARKVGCEAFINTGSCFEYGNGDIPFKEKDAPKPVNTYGATKVAAVELGRTFYRAYKLPVITLRPFTVYGSLEGEGRFITTVIRNCLNGDNLKLIKETVIRDYIFIEDVVDAYFTVFNNIEKLKGEILNISTGKGNAIRKVAEMVISLTKAKDIAIEVGGFPAREGEVFSLIGDPSKARSLIGWKAKFSLEDGIRRIITSLKI